MRDLFLIDPDIHYLNVGSFGACPKPVFEVYQSFQREFEYNPVQFMTQKGPKYIQASREALAKFIHADAEDLVYVPNPTTAVNLVAKNFTLHAGDEVISTSLEYGACTNTWQYYCQQQGAKFIQVPIQLPIQDADEIVAAIMNACSHRTKLIFISHITSSTALILPVSKIILRAHEKGIPVFVDGAHAPGHIDLDIMQLQPDYYTGACHKWMMTPNGSSFLYVDKKWQPRLDPLIISWGYDTTIPAQQKFYSYHQFNGTRDFSAYLCIPEAIKFRTKYNWEERMSQCKTFVHTQANRFANLLSTQPLAPLHINYIAQMLSLPIQTSQPTQLQQKLYDSYQIEIPIMQQGTQTYIRFSWHPLNHEKEIEALWLALHDLIQQQWLIV